MDQYRPAARKAIAFVCAAFVFISLTESWTTTQAQPLIEQVPRDALVYFGWAGSETLKDAYAQSTLKNVADLIDAPRIADAWRRVQPALRQAVDDPEYPLVTKHLTVMGGVSCRGAMAVYVTAPPPGLTEEEDAGSALPGVAMLWQPVGAEDRLGLLAGLKYFADQSTVATEVISDGPVVALLINHPRRVDPRAVVEPGAGSLLDEPGFVNALTQLDTPGPLMGYADLPRLTALVIDAAMGNASPGDREKIVAVLDVLQPQRLGPALATAGFDGRRWATRVHLGATAPRTGLAGLLDAPALTADDLARPPAETSWTVSLSLDTNKLMDLIRAAVTAAGPEAADAFEEGLARASGMLGIDVEEQLIRGLGSAWTLYTSPEAAGDSLLGLTIVNPLADAAGVERGLRSIQMFGNMAMIQNNDPDMNWQVHTQRYGEHDIHSFPALLASPSWAVIEGQLVIGLYPQTVVAAIDRGQASESLNQREDFAAVRDAVGTRRLTGLAWLDIPAAARTSYPQVLIYENLLTGWASLSSGQPMPMILPPYGRLAPHLEPAHGFAWIDDAGWHYHSQMPFPGATMLAPQGSTTTAVVPLGVGMLLPALGAARRTARQMQDQAQGRGIHQAMVMYAQRGKNGDGKLPDDIGVLIEGNYFSPDYTVSPSSGTRVPADIKTWPISEQADWVHANADYILVPGLTDDQDPFKIAVFLRPDIYNEPGSEGRGTVIYNDNSANFDNSYNMVEDQLLQQTGKTIQQLIDRQIQLAPSD